jgi:ribosomal protein L21E
MIALSTYLKQYKVGDIVDVVANGAVQKGMVCGRPRRSAAFAQCNTAN